MIEFFSEIATYKFLANAAIAVVLLGVMCGIVGTYIVSRRLVFLSGGITHASFGGIGVAYFLGGNPIVGALAASVLSALGVEMASSRLNIREDSAIGVVWSLGMAVGIMFIFLTPGYTPNLITYLFGNILAITDTDIALSLSFTALLLAVFALFYRKIVYVSFDRNYALSQRGPVQFVNYLMMVMVSLAIVLTIKLTGIVLLISLLTIPVVIAGTVAGRFATIAVWSSVIGIACGFCGLWISLRTNIPVSASIVMALAAAYIVVKLGAMAAAKQRNLRKKAR